MNKTLPKALSVVKYTIFACVAGRKSLFFRGKNQSAGRDEKAPRFLAGQYRPKKSTTKGNKTKAQKGLG